MVKIRLPFMKKPTLKKKEELGFDGPMKIILVQPLDKYEYIRRIVISLMMLSCHYLIGVTVVSALWPWIVAWFCCDFVVKWKFQLYVNHVFYTMLGFTVIIPESIMIMNPYALFSRPPSRHSHKICVHAITQIIGTAIGIYGIYYHYLSTKQFKMNTKHGITGVVASGLSLISMLTGVCSCVSSVSACKLKTLVRFLKTLHLLTGSAAFFSSSTCLLYGYTKYLTFDSPLSEWKPGHYVWHWYDHIYKISLSYICCFYTFAIAAVPFGTLFSFWADEIL